MYRFDVDYVNDEVGCKHFPSDLGDYVLADDALKLQAKVEELTAELNNHDYNLGKTVKALQAKVKELTDALEHIKQYESVRTRGRPFSSAVFKIADKCLKDQESE